MESIYLCTRPAFRRKEPFDEAQGREEEAEEPFDVTQGREIPLVHKWENYKHHCGVVKFSLL